MRFLTVILASLLLYPMAPAVAQVDVPAYPRMIAVARSPVYFDPGSTSNYFFYDGMYWVYESDSWYTGSWFNGPWTVVAPLGVPVYLLRVPVRFYRNRPVCFRGWNPDEPPRWGDHWGTEWERQRRGWDRWEPTSAPRPCPSTRSSTRVTDARRRSCRRRCRTATTPSSPSTTCGDRGSVR